MSLVDLSRWQFAFTVMFHMTFPAITVGLSIFLPIIYAVYWRTKKPVLLQMFRFWRRIFAVGFVICVVAGAVIIGLAVPVILLGLMMQLVSTSLAVAVFGTVMIALLVVTSVMLSRASQGAGAVS